MGRSIRQLTLKGYKSIRILEDFELGPINVLRPRGKGDHY